MTAPYTAADSSSVALAEEELAAIKARTNRPPAASLEEAHCNLTTDLHAVVAELTRAREAVPDDLRAAGWSVACHNDYRQLGERFTFWLFTKGDRCIKGEGQTDAAALNIIRAALGDAFAEATASKEEPAE